MTEFSKKYKFFAPIIFGVVFVLLNFLIVNTTWAGSCRCFDDRLFTAPACQENITKSECDNQNARGKIREDAWEKKCQYFADNSCGNSDPEAIDPSLLQFDKCWTQTACENDQRGKWASKEDSPDCKPLGGEGGVETRRCLIATQPIALQIGIPGVTEKVCSQYNYSGKAESCNTDEDCVNKQLGTCKSAINDGFPGYIQKFAKFFIGMLAVSAVVMVMWGGFKRIIAAGNAERISDSNEAIFGAIIGLVLALISYTLLNLINPKLIENSGVQIDRVRTQSLGDWCPDPLPNDPSKHISCGEWNNFDGKSCKGASCSPTLGFPEGAGCYPVNYSAGNVEYKCTNSWAACANITDDNVKGIHGSASDSHDIFTSACANYSDKNGQCLWMETSNFGTAVTILGVGLSTAIITVASGGIGIIPALVVSFPLGYGGTVAGSAALAVASTSGGLLSDDDRCVYMSNTLKNTVCQGGTFGDKTFTAPNDCGDFEDVDGELAGLEFPFCYYDLCKMGCRAEWNLNQRWSCEPDLDL